MRTAQWSLKKFTVIHTSLRQQQVSTRPTIRSIHRCSARSCHRLQLRTQTWRVYEEPLGCFR